MEVVQRRKDNRPSGGSGSSAPTTTTPIHDKGHPSRSRQNITMTRTSLLLLLILLVCFILFIYGSISFHLSKNSSNASNQQAAEMADAALQQFREAQQLKQVKEDAKQVEGGEANNENPPLVENNNEEPKKGLIPPDNNPSDYSNVVKSLMELAHLPPETLRTTLVDYFSLVPLETQETCPITAWPEWLPIKRQASERTSYHWKHRPKPPKKSPLLRLGAARQDEEEISNVPVGVWYDHLSKAGGTSFCQMADERMGRVEVPAYHCMPSDEKSPDARVGQWSNLKLIQYFHSSGKHLVSNEWEPFPLDKFELQAQSEQDLTETSGSQEKLWLLFITTIREPLDRLLSAHKFWGVLHNREDPHPTFSQWLKRKLNGAKADFARPRQGLGKPGSNGADFLAMIGRPNFATWKFSAGTLPVIPDQTNTRFPLSDGNLWETPFQLAIETLARFDLVIPMEVLNDHPQPLNDLLGWEHDQQARHVVTVGKIHNNNARAALENDEEYNTLWDANRLDMILYHWIKAVYLTRIRCEL